MSAELPPFERAGIAQARLLVVVADVEDDGTAVLADEVVVPDGEAAARVGDILVEQVVRLAGGDRRRRKRIDEMAARAHRAELRTSTMV